MFTGIVAAVGRIESVKPLGTDGDAGVRLNVEAGGLDLEDVQLGDSITIQGACMTVVEKAAHSFEVDVSRESLNCTVGLGEPGEVNLEKALRAHDRLGGHIVSGHIDGLGTVTRFAPVGESHELRVLAPRDIGRYLAFKGSITVNGVSLTVNSVSDRDGGCEFSINLIPHTVQVTSLKNLREGSQVNLEIDLIARYVERMLSTSQDGSNPLK
ncbi:Riboflavin synthase [Paraburkholderia domus]|uniref:Riboflavin synthase n=1 Tax=Paraburkholderia domus TaxID=2793075 RepID=A0A9N8MM89_9BURK|nr:riboflavin synthase [Paraburkholderia domus]MBK5047285.1 riboflavin synthase [Burkholderia sp. R-70006]MBK5059144.1 riboflavin synthase [Burkholderia sp. R-70199]MBK5086158.1 riboflavin synthase [Burkholderia sp. R-69927]MBK5163226.1 riboflavin synthase [Burkholderia sp. R-70211]MBK5179022.1 riboflavin synthase [Burkholderia sp. R-69749]MCI0145304.1 riboflavin synthase [Paraburkholderia sediminicola]